MSQGQATQWRNAPIPASGSHGIYHWIGPLFSHGDILLNQEEQQSFNLHLDSSSLSFKASLIVIFLGTDFEAIHFV